MIPVSKPFLPEPALYNSYLEGIWKRHWLTNNGPLVQDLEQQLKKYLGVKHLIFVNNGTIALQIALKALNKRGDIITTPFSYVATTNTILWEGCRPVFADVQHSDFNIDPELIEKLITPQTVAILATHVYGNPCNIGAIEEIANRHQLTVIYDGAHAFGASYNGKQILAYGDISTCSFHATKVFHCVEGGAIITNNDQLAEIMTHYRQCGHKGDDYFTIGINGKNSEFHAAMGLCLLPMMEQFIARRKQLTEYYDSLLNDLSLQRPIALPGTTYNYSYYPVILDSEERLIRIKTMLEQHGILARRYFYPSLNQLPQYTGESCPVSESISLRALALPLFYDLKEAEVARICDLVKSCF